MDSGSPSLPLLPYLASFLNSWLGEEVTVTWDSSTMFQYLFIIYLLYGYILVGVPDLLPIQVADLLKQFLT